MSPGKPWDEAVDVLCHAQDGGPIGGTHVRDSGRYSVASRDPKASTSCSASCLQSQAPLPVKNSGDCKQQEGLQMAILSPKDLPHCERHMKQGQALFCEDHGEPICLICRLSQEHQGHRVRPIEEAALEYKVGLPVGDGGLDFLCWSLGHARAALFSQQPREVGALTSILGL